MTEHQKRLIASLKNEPAFVALLDHLDEEVGEMLGALEDADIPADIMRLTRVWQVARKLVSRLRLAPDLMHEVLLEETQKPGAETNYWGMQDDDPFTRRPIPPPCQAAVE